MKAGVLTQFGAALLITALIAGCNRAPQPKEPQPTPTPTPISIPSRKMETSRLFNGMRVKATVQADYGQSATQERQDPESYTLNLEVRVKVPKAHASVEALSVLNPKLPHVLPALATLTATGTTSEFFADFYQRKLRALNYDLPRLNEMLSRHNFYDCETILELQHPKSKRRALLIQSDMDVVMDGSDSDRVPHVDGSSTFFQPMTSYKWPKTTANQNNFLPGREQRVANLQKELAQAPAARKEELKKLLGEARYEVEQLKKSSFLVSTVDPFVVVPGSLYSQKNSPYAPKLGDYCVVIYDDMLYPAIVGDIGPTYKMGEASLRLSKQINARATAYNRPVSELKVTYLIFPESADKPFAAPDLEKWHTRCEQLLKELGGFGGHLFAWEDVTKPKPTPTPQNVSPLLATPTPTPMLPELPILGPSPLPESAPGLSGSSN